MVEKMTGPREWWLVLSPLDAEGIYDEPPFYEMHQTPIPSVHVIEHSAYTERIRDLEEQLTMIETTHFPKFRNPEHGYGFKLCNRCDGMVGDGSDKMYYPPNHQHHWCKCYDPKKLDGSAAWPGMGY